MSQEHEDLQFRITGWPGLLPRPAHSQPFSYVLDGDGILAAELGPLVMHIEQPALEGGALVSAAGARPDSDAYDSTDAAPIASTGEVYLELVRVDLDDPKAILRFVECFGPLGVAYGNFSLIRDLPGFAEYVLPQLAGSWPGGRWGQTDADYTELRGSTPNSLLVETLDEFRLGARCVRDLVRAWGIAVDENPPETVMWESLPQEAVEWNQARLAEYGVELDARTEALDIFLRQVLSRGLMPFHPRITYVTADTTDLFDDTPVYAICCLELYNHIVERATYRRCENEPCGRLFVRQRGRAEQGHYRSEGIKYCSKHCARAKAQRQFRARKAAQRRSEKRRATR
jgi:hypothetical protein